MKSRSIRHHLFCILFLLLALPIYSQTEPGRLSNQVIPKFQRIELTLNPEYDRYTGKVDIYIHVKQKTQTIRFHGEQLDIEVAVLKKGDQEHALTHQAVDFGMIEVSSMEDILPVHFNNNFNTNSTGLFKVKDGEHHYCCTQFEAI